MADGWRIIDGRFDVMNQEPRHKAQDITVHLFPLKIMSTGWDDLFAAAAGDATNSEPDVNQTTNQEMNNGSSRNSRKKNKKKRKHSISQRNGSSLLDTVLDSRMDPLEPEFFPVWMKLGSSLIDSEENNEGSYCKGWKRKKTDSMMCENCGLSPLYHCSRLKHEQLRASKVTLKFLQMFLLIRDIRCCCSNIVSGKSGNSSFQQNAAAALTKSKNMNEIITSSTATDIPDEELAIFREKCNKVCQSAKNFHRKTAREEKSKESPVYLTCFDEIVSLIIDCDGAYYRLYYLQITGALPLPETLGTAIFIPHPHQYFGTNFMSWDIPLGQISKKEFCHELLVEKHSDIFQLFIQNFNCDSHNKNDTSPDPLTLLHDNRYMEGILLFHKSGWDKSESAHLQTIKAVEMDCSGDFYDLNETPAARVLAKWRNSCRDLVCNLYAYAVIPSSFINCLHNILREHGATDGIVEVGAGTGYLARLMRASGLQVQAFDVAPPRSFECNNLGAQMNEYHGFTPTFSPVHKGNSTNFMSFFKGVDCAPKMALLLCYPPPQSTMAEEVLRSYTSFGGRVLVFIGEFKGLTGSLKFENILRNNFKVLRREPCPRWGNDAAEISVWVRKSKDEKRGVKSCILPCSTCNLKEAEKRCRLYRPLAYCSVECFRKGKNERRIYFSLNFVPLKKRKGEDLDFDNPKHFQFL